MHKNNERKVAVITGGASGIGFSLAKLALNKQMTVFICDIEKVALDSALCELQLLGEVYAFIVDVANKDDVNKFSKKIFDKVGRVDYLFNNAGIGGAIGCIWKTPIEVLRHVFEINVVGMIHCLQAFIPKMIDSGIHSHVVNMSSNAGVTSMPYFGQYQITKHGVVTLSESLHYELSLLKSNIHVSVVCPGFVNTNISTSSRNYPNDVRKILLANNKDSNTEKFLNKLLSKIQNGSKPCDIANYIFKQINKNQFYIFPHKSLLSLIKNRIRSMGVSSCMSMPSLEDWMGAV